MSYRFKLQETIAEGVRRIGLEQIEIAETKLAGNDNVAASIHDARRCLKRVRALIRLVRPALGEDLYRQETERLARIGRLLADARDQHVMQQTLTKLEHRFGTMPSNTAKRLQRLIATGSGGGKRRAADGRRPALVGLRKARKLFSAARIESTEFEHVTDGLERAYRKARRSFRKAYGEPGDETFHALRKTAQLHWRHMQLLSGGWPEALQARAHEARELSRLLGEDHDFAVLHTFINGRAASILAPEVLAMLTSRCVAYQSELRERAQPHGERLFAEPAENLSSRVAHYWSAAQRIANRTSNNEGAQRPEASSAVMKPLGAAKYRSRRSRQ
jgi:CHAD domain-containing protein